MKSIRFYLMLLFAVACINSKAQIIIKGRVTDDKGAAIGGATVKVKNKSKGVITQANGRFTITLEKLPSILMFSGIGLENYYATVTEKTAKDSNFTVKLKSRSAEMDEVVVTGYAAEKDMDDYAAPTTYYNKKSIGTATYMSKLEAAVPGVSVSSTYRSVADDKYNFTDTVALKEKIREKAKILTAGEINDFKKWEMWKDLEAKEFEAYSKEWGITTKNRYSVQIVNRQFDALINIPVELIDNKTGKTVWAAKTDNTGKAELWANIFKDADSDADYSIKCNNDYTINNPVAFKNGINYISLNKACYVSNKVNIAFVVDATGSMGDEIEFLKMELDDIISHTQTAYKDLDLKLASVFYRDKSDDYLTRELDFTNDLSTLMNFIEKQRADGGGDEPEAVDAALDKTINNLKWDDDARARIVFLVLDAPPHDEAKERVMQLIEKAAKNGIRIIPIACSGSSKSNEFLLRSMALATNGMYGFLTNHSGVGGNHLEPSTDRYDVELLNTVMKRMISECVYAKECNQPMQQTIPMQKNIPNVAAITVAPNPTKGYVKLSSNVKLSEVYLCDFTGKILQKTDLKNNAQFTEFHLDNYPNGMYLIKYLTEDKKWGSERVVLMH